MLNDHLARGDHTADFRNDDAWALGCPASRKCARPFRGERDHLDDLAASAADRRNKPRLPETQAFSSIASAFTAARRTGRTLPGYPGAIPGDLAAAIQEVAIGLWAEPIIGWKIGRIGTAALRAMHKEERLAGRSSLAAFAMAPGRWSIFL